MVPTASPTLCARAPLRLSFAGGGTDVPPVPEREGGLVLSATINRYACSTLRPRADGGISIESHDFGTALRYAHDEPLVLDGNLDLVKAAILRLGDRRCGGFELQLRSCAAPGTGLGSSSAMIVAVVGLLKEFQGRALTSYEIANLAYLIERTELGLPGGMQDHYAATFGGFNFIEFHADRVIVHRLRVPRATARELERRLILIDTGTRRPSDRIMVDQRARYEQGLEEAVGAVRAQKEFAIRMRDALMQSRLDEFGEMLAAVWVHKQRMSPKIATPRIDAMLAAAIDAGSVGGKVVGAGGGGHMLLYSGARARARVVEAVTRLGARPVAFAFEPRGLTAWRASSA